MKDLEQKVTTLEQASDTLAAKNVQLRRELDRANQENMLLRARVSPALASGTADPALAPISVGELDYSHAMLPGISGPASPGTYATDDCPPISGPGSQEAWLVAYSQTRHHYFQHRPESVPSFPERAGILMPDILHPRITTYTLALAQPLHQPNCKIEDLS